MSRHEPAPSVPATNVIPFRRPERRTAAAERVLLDLLREVIPHLRSHVVDVAVAGAWRARVAALGEDVGFETSADELRATRDEVVIAGVDLAEHMEAVIEFLSDRLGVSLDDAPGGPEGSP